MKPQSQQTTASVKKPTTEYALYMHREELRRRKLHFQRIFHTKIQLTHELITRRQRNIGYCSFEDLQIINREKAFQQNLQRNLYQRRQQIQQAMQVQRHEMMQKHKQHIMQKHQQSVIQQQQQRQQLQQQQQQPESKGCQQPAKIPKLSFAPMLYTQQQPSVQQQQQRLAILPMQHSIVQIAGPVIIQNVQFVQQQQPQQQPQQRQQQQQQQQPFHHQQLMNQKLVVQNQLLMHKHQQAKQLPQRFLLSLKLKPLKRLQK